MENASKALLIAGAILIAILIVSLGVLIFTRMSSSAKEAANMDEQEIANFNSKITPYVGEKISGSQVNSLIQLIISIDQSAVSSKDKNKVVTIKYPIEGSTTPNTISVDTSLDTWQVTGTGASKRVKTGPSSYYKVEATYGTNGIINEIKVTSNP